MASCELKRSALSSASSVSNIWSVLRELPCLWSNLSEPPDFGVVPHFEDGLLLCFKVLWALSRFILGQVKIGWKAMAGGQTAFKDLLHVKSVLFHPIIALGGVRLVLGFLLAA